MTQMDTLRGAAPEVPQALMHALFRQPQALQLAMADAGLAAADVAQWARQAGDAPELEKLASWLSVGQHLGRYKPLLDAAAAHLHAGDLLEALPVFRWAYQTWQAAADGDARHDYWGAKLLALWGECLYRLNQPEEAQKRWLWALYLIHDTDTLTLLLRATARSGAAEQYPLLLAEAVRRQVPGAADLWQHRKDLPANPALETRAAEDRPASQAERGGAVAVMADVANLEMVCRDQYGPGWQLNYIALLQAAARHGPVPVKSAFVPDIAETYDVRQRLERAGFQVELQRPKRTHGGRLSANADAVMAACTVRWASDPHIARLELWTGDGDFLAVRDVVTRTWPRVRVIFRSLELGTAAGIRQLGNAWTPIRGESLQAERRPGPR